jgi:hypothetical protein
MLLSVEELLGTGAATGGGTMEGSSLNGEGKAVR